jgi:hypothetical protein
LTVFNDHRGFYTYSATYNDTGFRITATYSGPANPQAPATFSIDENMQVQ